MNRPSWFIWDDNSSTDGMEFYSHRLAKANDLLMKNNSYSAERVLDSIIREPEAPAEKREAVLRKVAIKLADKRGEEGLKILTEEFKARGITANRVGRYPAVLLGHAYRLAGDENQSLAWFSRAMKTVRDDSKISRSANEGIQELIRNASPDSLELIKVRWNNDQLVSKLVDDELANRQKNMGEGSELSANDTMQPADETLIASQGLDNQFSSDATVNLVAILPTSGKYKSLGKSTKNGIELITNQFGKQAFSLRVLDSGAGIENVTETLASLIAAGEVDGIVGPLVSSFVSYVAPIAREAKIPMLHLSKRDNIDVGRGVFRLGVTAQSQISALLNATSLMGVRSVSIVCPYGETGDQYIEDFRNSAGAYNSIISSVHRYQKRNTPQLLEIANKLGGSRDGQVQQEGQQGLYSGALFFCGSPSEAVQLKTAMSKRLRDNLTFLALGSWYDLAELKHFQSALDGTLIVAPFFSESDNTHVVSFKQAYRRKFSRKADFLSAQGFDAAFLVYEAVRRAKSGGYQSIRSIQKLPLYEGLTGNIRILENGELDRRFAVVQLKGGKLLGVRS